MVGLEDKCATLPGCQGFAATGHGAEDLDVAGGRVDGPLFDAASQPVVELGLDDAEAGQLRRVVVLKPLTLDGSVLRANFATSSIGYVKIAVLDEGGDPLPGYGVADAEELAGDEIDRNVTWKSGKGIADLRGRTVRLKFIVRDADLYSFGAFAK